MSTIDEINELAAYTLAGMAEVAGPDAIDSPGAIFLTDIRDEVVEAFEESGEISEQKHGEIADGAASVSTHVKWQQFVDLCAYREDLSEFGEPTKGGIEGVADLALYCIAHRLVTAIVNEIQEG